MRFVVIICALLVWASGSGAKTSALLIGVSDYDDASGIADLNGPRNDVTLMRDVLTRKGVTEIAILADGVDGGAVPTRAAILDALAALAATSQSGDFVYVHYSGHGTQQPDANADESDGMDEVLLPADAGHADPATGLIANAIMDDELGAAIARIRATGASVWVVLDSCHSGSGLRSGGNGRVADRYVDPATLGVSVRARGGTFAEPGTEADLPQGNGGLMAFYSAQSWEVAREVDFAPADQPAQWYGLFTSKLAAQLDAGGGQSFRQLFQATLRDMNDQTVPGAARLQTPYWQGDMLDAPVLGAPVQSVRPRFELRGDEVLGGLVHGIADGTLLELVADAADPDDAVLGYAQAEWAEATTAIVRPVAASCVPQTGALCDFFENLPEGAKFAQIAASPVDMTIRFSRVIDAATQAPLGAGHPAMARLKEAISAVGPRAAIDPAGYDVEVVWDGAALWFSQSAVLKGHPIGLRSAAEGDALARVLVQIVRAETTDRLLNALVQNAPVAKKNPITVQGVFKPVDPAYLIPASRNVSASRECRVAIGRRDAAMDAPLAPGQTVKQCDMIEMSGQARVAGAYDINRINISVDYCVEASHVRVEGTELPVGIGDLMTFCSDCDQGTFSGQERMYVLVSKAVGNQVPLNLTNVIGNCDGAQEQTRSPRDQAVGAFLNSLSEGRATRSKMAAVGVQDMWVDRFTWTLLPKALVVPDP